MIFAVAGSQLPFPRMMQALHEIAPQCPMPIFAQTADPEFQSDRIESTPFLDPTVFEEKLREARIIVAHAGIGILIAAATHAKPLILFPRQARFSEHRNDHQMATAKRFSDRPGLKIVHDTQELGAALQAPPPAMGQSSNPLTAQFLDTIRAELS